MAATYVLFGGGGVRGSFTAACIGYLQLSRHPLASADVVAGVSIGSIIGACLATETSILDILGWLKTSDVIAHHSTMTNMFRTLQIYRGRRQALFSTDTIAQLLEESFGSKPVRCQTFTAVAGDAMELVQEEFETTNGSIIAIPTVLASCAILGAYPPVQLQKPGKPAAWYIDGGFQNAFPMQKIKEFMDSDVAEVMSLYASKPWLARIPDIGFDEFSVRNTTAMLLRKYWYSLSKLDHLEIFKIVPIPLQMIPDGIFAAVFTLNNQAWALNQIITPQTTNYARPPGKIKVVYFCAPVGEQYAQYETMNLSQRHEEREQTMALTIKFGEVAAQEMKKIYNIVNRVEQAPLVQIQSTPLSLSFRF